MWWLSACAPVVDPAPPAPDRLVGAVAAHASTFQWVEPSALGFGAWQARAGGARLLVDGDRVELRDLGSDAWAVRMHLAGFGRDAWAPLPTGRETVEAAMLTVDHGPVEVFYERRPEGFKQGFRLERAPPGDGPVAVVLDVGEALFRLTPGSVLFGGPADPAHLRMDALVVSDADGRPVPAWFGAEDGRLVVRIDDRGATWPLLVDPLLSTPQATVAPDADDVDAWFGQAVALSGDRLFVGAPDNLSAPSTTGAVYVFARDEGGDGTWGKVAEIAAPAGALGFGGRLSVDGETLVVGAPDTASSAGGAWVFAQHEGGTEAWGMRGAVVGDAMGAGDRFGGSVSVEGGFVAVGAPGDDRVASNAGSVSVFAVEDLSLLATRTASDFSDGAGLGVAVALDGQRLLAGAAGRSGADGGAYLFDRNDGGADTWRQVAIIEPPPGLPAGSRFGEAVALDGDRALVGAPAGDSGHVALLGEDVGGLDAWGVEIGLAPPDGVITAGYGETVALVDGVALIGAQGIGATGAFVYEVGSDWGLVQEFAGTAPIGHPAAVPGVGIDAGRLVVGDPGAEADGRATVFERSGTAYTAALSVAALDPTADMDFGWDLDSDGDWLLVGAPQDDEADVDAGAAFVFGRDEGGPGAWGLVSRLLSPAPEASAEFGYAVAIDDGIVAVGAPADDYITGILFPNNGTVTLFEEDAGGDDSWRAIAVVFGTLQSDQNYGYDVDLDGEWLIASAPRADSDQGKIFVFRRNETGPDAWGSSQTLTVSDGAADDELGRAVALDGGVLVAGAPFRDDAASDGGAAIVWRLDAGTWVEEDVLVASATATGDHAGLAVSVRGDLAVVGAPDATMGGTERGRAAVFRFAGAWSEEAALVAGTPGDGDEFGFSAHTDGNLVAIGVPGVATDRGEVEVFARSGPGWVADDRLQDAGALPLDRFGRRVRLDGDALWVSAVNGDGGVADAGEVHRFELDADFAPVLRAASYELLEDEELSVPAPALLGGAYDADGDSIDVVLASAPAHGAASVTAEGAFSYSPDADFVGVDSFSVSGTDGLLVGEAVVVSLTVLAEPDPPRAVDDLAAVAEDGVVFGSVATNDTDPDSDDLVFSLLTPPLGTVLLGADGSFEYRPLADQTGADSFVYEVMDGGGLSDNGRVSVTIAAINDPPVAGDDGPYAATEDLALVVPAVSGVLTNDVDIDSVGLTASLSVVPGHGAVTVQPTGAFEYVPEPDWSGTDTFVVSVSDGFLSDTSLVTVVATAVDDAPRKVLAFDAYITAEDTLLSVVAPGLAGAFSDPEGEGLTVSLAGPAVGGVATVNPSGGFSFAPSPDFFGVGSFPVVACDGPLCSAPSTVLVTVSAVDDAPRIVGGAGPYATPEDVELVVVDPGVLVAFSDPEGDPLVATISGVPSGGTVAVSAGGGFNFQPAADFTGAGGFLVVACDGPLCSAPVAVTVNVAAVDDAPRVVAVAGPYLTDEDTTLDVMAPGVLAAFEDPEGELITVSAVGAPVGGSVVVAADGAFAFIPAADFAGDGAFDVTACDGPLCSELLHVVVAVDAVDDAPRLVGLVGPFAVGEDTTLTVGAPGVLAAYTEPDGEDLDATLVSDAPNGSVTVFPSGAIQFVPDLDFTGNTSFTATACDPGAECGPPVVVTVTVGGINDPPAVVASVDAVVTDEDVPTGLVAPGVLAAFEDAEGDPLTAQLAAAADPTLAVVSVGLDGSVTLAPTANAFGEGSFSVRACDPSACSEPLDVAFTVSPVNDLPILVTPVLLLGTDEDVVADLSRAAWEPLFDDVDGELLTPTVVGPAQIGSVSVLADGTVRYTPGADVHGLDSFELAACDAEGCAASAAVSVEIESVPDAPRAVPDFVGFATDEDVTLVLGAGALDVAFVDPDGEDFDTLLVAAPALGALSLSADGSFTYSPLLNLNGADTFIAMACGGDGCSADATIPVAVAAVNDAPTLTVPTASSSADEDLQAGILLTGKATDVEGDPISWVVTEAFDGCTVTFNLTSAVVTPPQDFHGKVYGALAACDASACSADLLATVTFISVNDRPVWVEPLPLLVVLEDTPTPLDPAVVLAAHVDADGDILAYKVETAPDPAIGTFDPIALVFTPASEVSGVTWLNLNACDGIACTDPTTRLDVQVVAVDDAPVALFGFGLDVDEDSSLDLPAPGPLVVFTDVEGDPLTAVLATPPPAELATVTLSADGALAVVPAPDAYGDTTFEVIACGVETCSAPLVVSLDIAPLDDPPRGNPDAYVVAEGDVLVVDADAGVLANDEDVDGDGLAVGLVAGPAWGVLALSPDGGFSFDPLDGDAFGPLTFVYAVSDGVGPDVLVDVVLDVLPVDDAPSGPAERLVLLAEDESYVEPAPGFLAGVIDVEGDEVTAALAAPPPFGAVDVAPDGGWSWVPPSDAWGVAAFAVSRCEALAPTVCAPPLAVTIEVLPVDDAPALIGSFAAVTDEDVPLEVAAPGLLDAFADADGDPLTVELRTPADPGLADVVLDGDGHFVLTPAPDANGAVTFDVVACDAWTCSAPLTVLVDILPVDDAPRAVAGEWRVAVGEDVPVEVVAPGVLAAFVDVEGDPMSALAVVDVDVGTFELAADGGFSYAPAQDFAGSARAELTACAQGLCSPSLPVWFDVSAVNDPPVVVAALSPLVTLEDIAVDLPPPGVLVAFADADGDPLHPEQVGSLDPSFGVLDLVDDGAAHWEPAADVAGTQLVDVRACDAESCSDSVPFEIRVDAVDDAPRALPVYPSWATDEDVALVEAAPGVLVVFEDVDGDPMSAESVDGLASVASDGSFAYLPPADATGALGFTVRACGTGGCSEPVLIGVDVAPVDDPPRLVGSVGPWTVDEDVAWTLAGVSALWTDIEGDPVVVDLVAVDGPFTVSVAEDLTISPLADAWGEGTVALRACGVGCAEPVVVDVVVDPVDDAPRPLDDTLVLLEDTPGGLAAPGVLANDTEVDGEALVPTLLAAPPGFVVELHGDGAIDVTVPADQWGAFVVDYAVSDGVTEVAARVWVDVAPSEDPTEVVGGPSYTTDEDVALEVAPPGLAAAFFDADGVVEPAVAIGPARGDVVLTGGGGFVYTPSPDLHGPDSFFVAAPDGAAVEVLVDVAPVDDAPRVVGLGSFTTPEDVALSVGVADLFSEVDGELLTFALGAAPLAGNAAVDANGGLVYTPSPDANGLDALTVVATDPGGASAEVVVTVDVAAVPDAPVALGGEWTAVEDETLVVDADEGLLAGAFDADGDPLEVVVVPPVDGVLEVDADGGFRYTPAADAFGRVGFAYSVNDGLLSSASVDGVIDVVGVDDAPRSVPKQFAVIQESLLDAPAPGALADDYDPEGASLVASLVEAPVNGTLELDADGAFRYAPDPLFVGVDGFVYIASDGAIDGPATAVTLDVTPKDRPPVLVDDSWFVDEDEPLDVAAPGVLANDVDPEGLPLTVLSVVGGLGDLAVDPDGAVHYLPPVDFFGTDVFTVEVSDAGGLTSFAEIAVDVLPVNDAPVCANDAYDAREMAALSVPAAEGVLANDADVDSVELTAVLVMSPSHGGLTLGEDGSFTYIPAADGFDGIDTFTYKASDGLTDGNVAVVTVDVEPIPLDTGGPGDTACEPSTWYKDQDHDGFGDPRESIVACAHEASDAYVLDRNDCDDGDAGVHPDAEEVPNDHVDQDCDGEDLFVTAAGGCACESSGKEPGVGLVVPLLALLRRRRASRIAPG